MRKSTLFISTVLTGFMLAVLYGVASAYQQVVKPLTSAASSQPAAVVQPVSQPVIPSQQPVTVTAETGAALASKVLGRTDLYSVEMSTYNGVDAYLVTFSSGDLVYVGLDGQILSVSKLQVTTIAQPSNGGGHHGGNGGGNNNSGGEHEGGDD